ncbi:MAG: hypothetical protein B0A82_24670 [Alkalinema sp. CACIAM 70d]|nr:MAG: hypothetical protein B0A82_24670 [Alkalinema sp. CACIAM 70d]
MLLQKNFYQAGLVAIVAISTIVTGGVVLALKVPSEASDLQGCASSQVFRVSDQQCYSLQGE